jgi:hypothetical protein
MPDPTQDLPRLCVIGTSNSAGKASYAGYLARSGAFATVVNRSLARIEPGMLAEGLLRIGRAKAEAVSGKLTY